MNTENEDSRTLPLPGLEIGQQSNAGKAVGIVSPLDQGELPQAHDIAQNAGSGGAKPTRRPRTAKVPATRPATLKTAEVQAARIEPKSVRSKRSPTMKNIGEKQEAEADETKPKRTPPRRRAKAAAADGAQPAPNVTAPAITPEAISFLSNENASAEDLFKLSPTSQLFVQHHFKRMHSLEEISLVTNAFLKANARPVSAAFQLFIDALQTVAINKSSAPTVVTTARPPEKDSITTPELSTASFAPRREPATLHTQISVKLRNLDIATDVAADRQKTLVSRVSDQSQTNVASTAVENSIEPSIAQLRAPPGEDMDDRTPTIQTPAKGPASKTDPLSQRSLRNRVLRFLGNWVPKSIEQDTPRVSTRSGAVAPQPADVQNPPVTPANSTSNVVPDAVACRFLKIEQRYYFPDELPAFLDRGNKLSTNSVHPEVVRSLVEIAKARGWNDITVKGSEYFRRSAWIEGASHGLKVSGYQPSTLDLAALANSPNNNSIEKTQEKRRSTVPASTGEKTSLDPTHAASAREPTVAAELTAKAKSFETEKASRAVKKYPELAGAYGLVEAAQAFAAENLPETARDAFVGMARRHVIQRITTGQQVGGPKVFLPPNIAKTSSGQAKSHARVDLGKSPRSKAQVPER